MAERFFRRSTEGVLLNHCKDSVTHSEAEATTKARKMWLHRTRQQPFHDEEIENLQQEINHLKRRLSRLEKRTDSRSYASTTSLQTNGNDDEGTSKVKISSSPSSIDASFKGCEDSLSDSSSLPIYDEPIYDEYDDDAFFGILDFDKPMYDDESKVEAPPENLVEEMEAISKEKEAQLVDDGMTMIGSSEDEYIDSDDARTCRPRVRAALRSPFAESQILVIPRSHMKRGRASSHKWSYRSAKLAMLKISRRLDIGWTYPDWFSQPNPPPYCGQPASSYEPEVPPTPVV